MESKSEMAIFVISFGHQKANLSHTHSYGLHRPGERQPGHNTVVCKMDGGAKKRPSRVAAFCCMPPNKQATVPSHVDGFPPPRVFVG